jgi:hypothetical protein
LLFILGHVFFFFLALNKNLTSSGIIVDLSRYIGILIYSILLSYYNEKQYRIYFHQIFIQKNYLEQFKKLVKDIVPEPIIVCNISQDDSFQIIFNNESCFPIFGNDNLIIENNLFSLKMTNPQFGEKENIGATVIPTNENIKEELLIDYIKGHIDK